MEYNRRSSVILASTLLCLGISLFVFWQTKGPQVVAAIREEILVRAAQVLNGRLAAESLDFSLSGKTTAHKLMVYDNQNNVIVSCDRVDFEFGLTDLLRGNFAPGKIRHVTLEGMRANLSHDANGHWNIEDLLKPTPDEDSFHFRGELKMSGAAASVSGPEGNSQFEQIEGTLDFAAYPDIKTNLTGRLGETGITAEGHWAFSGAVKMNLTIDRMETLQLMAFFPSDDKTWLKGGNIYDLTVVLRRDKGPLVLEADAFVSGLSVDFSGVRFADLAGKMKFGGNILEFQDATMQYGRQNLAAGGKIDFNASKPLMDLTVKGTSFELSALADDSPVTGAASFKAIVKGTPENLEIAGEFLLPSGTFSAQSFTDATGTFHFAHKLLTLNAVSLDAMGGKIQLSGMWNQQTASFEQDISGKNLDAVALSGGSILGTVDLQVRVTGKDVAGAKIQGTFSMPMATINGNVFEKISGGISKIGQNLEFTDLNFNTAGQKVTAAGKILLGGEDPELDMRIQSDGIEIASIKPDVPVNGLMAFQAVVTGSMKNHTITGSLQIPSGQFGELSFGDVDGDFQFEADVLTLQDVQFGLSDGSNAMQKMTAAGRILFTGSDPRLDLSVSSDGFDVKAVKPEFPLDGRLAFQALVAGTGRNPAIAGSFQISYGQIDALPFDDARGDFLFAAGVLKLKAVRINMLGGSVTAEGTIARTGTYLQQVSGQNIDVELLTDGDIRGKANFSATLHGEGRWAQASAEGKIAMKSGTIKNTGFSSLNLEFRKQGEQVEIPALDIKFLHGFVKGTGYTEGDYLVMKLSPAKNRKSRLLGIGTLLLFGGNPLAAILGQALSEQFPLGILRIRINGLKTQ